MRRLKVQSVSILCLFCIVEFYLVRGVGRSQTGTLLIGYALLFLLYIWIIRKESDVSFWLVGAMITRFVLLSTWPTLSDDFYRFVWDGRLMNAGLNPFAYIPSDIVQHAIPGVDQKLFEGLNSKNYYTVYPPVAQFVFWISTALSPDSVGGSLIIIRLLVILAEMGSIILLMKLLDRCGHARKHVLLYAMNPLIILELAGNLHFEAFAIFFVLSGTFLLWSDKTPSAAIAFALAIGAKLLPLILLPVLLPFLGWRKSLIFFAVTGVSCIVLFSPLINSEILSNYISSIALYLGKFEFNASIYYLVREYGFWKVGYNIIQTSGWKLTLVSVLGILAYSLSFPFATAARPVEANGRLFMAFMFILLLYLLFATTIHPWYLTPMIAFAVLTPYRFAIVWSALIFTTYTGYSTTGYSENGWLVAAEYLVIIGYLGYEVWRTAANPNPSPNEQAG
jgi:alpha-1,6-mannosyltransferase